MMIVHCINSTGVSQVWLEGRRGVVLWKDDAFPHQFFGVDELLRSVHSIDKPVVADVEENNDLNEMLRVLGEQLREKLGNRPFMVDYDHQWYDSEGNTRTSPAESRRQWQSAFWLGILAGIVSTIIVSYVLPWAMKLCR